MKPFTRGGAPLPWAALGQAPSTLWAQCAHPPPGGPSLSYLWIERIEPGLMAPPRPHRASRCSSCAAPTVWCTCTAAPTPAPC